MDAFDYAVLAALITLIGCALEILNRLPRPSRSVETAVRPAGWKSFAIWMNVTEVSDFKFEAGLMDQWHCGLEFEIYGDGECNENLPHVKRATVNFSSDINQELRKSEVFGRGKSSEKSVKLNIWLAPAATAQLLSLVSNIKGISFHAQGYEGPDGDIHVTYFTCEQSVLVAN